MWLLNTARAELHYFTDPASVPGGYAILSHTWSHSGEQTFQDVQTIISCCKAAGENPRDHVVEKIRRCCEIAEQDGYTWVWIDSCCIDKTSSTEVSEAINSMFTWYALSEVCYAFLEDVSQEDGEPNIAGSAFRRARWHTRGWTLQELLAPAFLVFLSAEWTFIGTKNSLCGLLADCTGIQEGFLTREWDFLEAPIAMRMSWAAGRKLTRVEDEAYSLLGLFGINMPTLYGEGSLAFQRLQAELSRQSPDTTLFAWGGCYKADQGDLLRLPLNEIYRGFHNPSYMGRFLFAMSPSDFRDARDFYYTPQLSAQDALQPYLPSQWTHAVRSL